MKLIKLMLMLFGMVILSSAVMAQDTRETRAELRFLEGMSDHHQMALDMANDCLAKAKSETLLTLCQNILDAQSAEIELMQGWLLDWYGVEYAPVPMEMDTDHEMPGMGMTGTDVPMSDPAMTMGMMAGLNRLEGREYEIAWVESMIDHHDDAVHMSERVLTRFEHEELGDLANRII
ncbi:MAG: DUF305 domain-containing protein, partial [Chloroflexota bacterium]